MVVWLSPRAVLLPSTNIGKVTGKQGGLNKWENIILFNPRRDLAVQVLSLLETLVSPESDWLWIAWHLDMSSFSVTRTGQVSNMEGEGEQHAVQGGSLNSGASHPCGAKPGGFATPGGERALQPQLLHGVETKGANPVNERAPGEPFQGDDGNLTWSAWQGLCGSEPICRSCILAGLQVDTKWLKLIPKRKGKVRNPFI